jgi:hypothetical protein
MSAAIVPITVPRGLIAISRSVPALFVPHAVGPIAQSQDRERDDLFKLTQG